jgi:hypothetical protein
MGDPLHGGLSGRAGTVSGCLTMGRNDDRFSDAQRKAIGEAMLAGGTSPEVAAAAAGELGVPSFEVSEATVRTLAQEARRNPDRLADIADRTLTLTEQVLERIEKASRPSNADLGQLKRLLPLAEHAARARKTADTLNRRPPPPHGDEPPTLLARLQAQQPETNGAESGDP